MQEINIPKYLQDLHGKKTSLLTLTLTYLSSIATATIITYSIAKQIDVSLWRIILTFILIADISGGIISNYSESTRKYYSENSKKHIIFIFMHILQPVFFIIIFQDVRNFFLFMGIYAISSCLAIYKIRNYEYKRIISSFLFIVGIIITFIFNIPIEIVKIIPILFFAKLILAYSNKDEKK